MTLGPVASYQLLLSPIKTGNSGEEVLTLVLSLPKLNNEIIMDRHKYSENDSTTAILALQICTKASKLRLLEIPYKIL